jgi:hypothetical protein
MELTQGNVSVNHHVFQKERIRMEICVPDFAHQYVKNRNYIVKLPLDPTAVKDMIIAEKEEQIKITVCARVFVPQLVMRTSI